MSTGIINLKVKAGVVTGPSGLSISKIVFKEKLPNGDSVYKVIREDNFIIGEFTIPKGEQGIQGILGPKGEDGVGISNITHVKEGLTNRILISLTNGTSYPVNLLDGESAFELWLGKDNEGTLEDFFEAYRGFSIKILKFKETLPNGDNVYEIFIDNDEKIGEFISPKGTKGNSFHIFKTYSSIVEMENDFINDEIPIGSYVVISSDNLDNAKLFEKKQKGFEFVVKMAGEFETLKPATKTKLGGVRVGVNMQINPDGVINPIYPISTKNGRGIVQIGEGINIDNGKISVGGSFRYNSSSVIFNKVDGEEMLERNNTAVGNEALFKTSSGTDNTAFGSEALCDRQYSASGNTALGSGSLRNLQYGDFNTAVGFQSGEGINDFSFTTCLGYKSTATGDHQLQLGDRSTTAYCYGSVQNRSDERDKTDIKDTELGLGFIMKLKPREYRFDYRESYRDYQEIDKIRKKIEKLNKKGRKINHAEALKIFDIENIKKDGSKKGWRLHQGFIAQEVFQTMRELGVDFGGYQDHSINGGKEVLSIGYTEFIPVLTKAIQEQQKQINELVKEMQQIKKHMEKTNE
ncbi:tail fiber domain-containing protein [Cetobacterium sp. 2A]|uniref:tail fiber domain-containing protein n=1 Tax=Cetobacterium sp. 2A TaxID=2754723 RepID=UPI00163C550C|nr:tail fiber domain-containing protein [Cetobacterium sp. 2A]MBC2855489.1 tail fiber domain-containing protein [Cetobacterium sp. 2A]